MSANPELQPEAEPKPQRDFGMPEANVEFLDANHPGWETITDQNINWLILNRYPIPEGFQQREARAAIMIPSGHPNAPLDMVYFFPPLVRTDGRPIVKPSNQNIRGEIWQRWSRHYSWRVGVDDLITHIERISIWLAKETQR